MGSPQVLVAAEQNQFAGHGATRGTLAKAAPQATCDPFMGVPEPMDPCCCLPKSVW